MKESEIIKELFKDIYNLQIRYMFIWLDDFLWERFIEEKDQLSDKYKQYGDDIWRLCRGMLTSLEEYKEKQQKAIKETMENIKVGTACNRILKIGKEGES